jgi:predicted adenylyl cyclase CyaB
MGSLSIEIKARCPDPARIRKVLLAHGASFKGMDRQVDTYFRVPSGRPAFKKGRGSPASGRLKLREGNIENALIYYMRGDQKKSKKCDAILFSCKKKASLKKILTQALGVLAVIEKKREIYFIRNAKFHIDRVKRLGNFVEIEVFGLKGSPGAAKLRKQCEFYQKLLRIRTGDLLADSYSDQLLRL